MPQLIITAGEKYNDIDALACGVAYKHLLDLQGIPSEVVFSGPLNESISKSVRDLGFSYKTKLEGNAEDYQYVMVDISDRTNVSAFVPLDKVVEVYDHRWGFEDYWKTRPDVKVTIDTVGSCATLIWEKYKENNLQNKIDSLSANLLYIAIISNTLNLKARITNKRDLAAVEELKSFTDLPNDWIMNYFNEVSASILKDPINAIKNDTKIAPINGANYHIMQVELWNSKEFINNHNELILDLLKSSDCDYSFLTSPSISEGINYLITLNEGVKSILSERIGAKFNGAVGLTDKLWLRKEIIRELSK